MIIIECFSKSRSSHLNQMKPQEKGVFEHDKLQRCQENTLREWEEILVMSTNSPKMLLKITIGMLR